MCVSVCVLVCVGVCVCVWVRVCVCVSVVSQSTSPLHSTPLSLLELKHTLAVTETCNEMMMMVRLGGAWDVSLGAGVSRDVDCVWGGWDGAGRAAWWVGGGGGGGGGGGVGDVGGSGGGGGGWKGGLEEKPKVRKSLEKVNTL